MEHSYTFQMEVSVITRLLIL